MFEYDVFLSYSHKDESIVHALANRLKQDGLRVWLDKWEIKPGDLIPLKIQRGLEKSHTLLMCMSPNYFDSEWGNMEHLTVLFRNPTNTQRRLIPLLITDCTPPDTIAQFAYIDWRMCSDDAYNDILDSCIENNPKLSLTNINSGIQLNIPKTFTSPYTGIEFVLISAGEFMMGSNESSLEKPVHKVKIKNFFYMSKYMVTQKQWKKVMKNNPSLFKSEDRPVETVSWNDVQEFIDKLNLMELTDEYRLPSEAEWEYACKAGTQTRYSFGDDKSKINEYAWYNENSGYETHPVGQKKPNLWGLYDMHGLVCELVQDKWHDNFDEAPLDGSTWETGSSSYRVARGSFFQWDAESCRSSNRFDFKPYHDSNYLGFRLVKDV